MTAKALWELSRMMEMFYILAREVIKVLITHRVIFLKSKTPIKCKFYIDKIITDKQTYARGDTTMEWKWESQQHRRDDLQLNSV